MTSSPARRSYIRAICSTTPARSLPCPEERWTANAGQRLPAVSMLRPINTAGLDPNQDLTRSRIGRSTSTTCKDVKIAVLIELLLAHRLSSSLPNNCWIGCNGPSDSVKLRLQIMAEGIYRSIRNFDLVTGKPVPRCFSSFLRSGNKAIRSMRSRCYRHRRGW